MENQESEARVQGAAGDVRFEPTRGAGLARLAAFLPCAGEQYAARRNFVEGPAHANVSALSPWLQKRLLLEEEVVAAARVRWGFRDAEKFIQEVYWRTYWKGWLEQRPEVWVRWREAVPGLLDGLRGERRSDWEAAVAGRTDIACFNAWVRELVETGWLHNHARMWFASIWIFTLRLPWELGAAFFYRHLLDGDAASNTLSWRWVAGLQTAGKTYVARADNIAKYLGSEYAPPPGRLATEAALITEPQIGTVKLAARSSDWRAGPADGGAIENREAGRLRTGLWLHPEDLVPEVGGLADAPVAGIFACWPRNIARRAGQSAVTAAWARSALAEGAMRAGAWFQCGAMTVEVDDLAEALVGWARQEKLDVIYAHEPAIGPWRDETGAVAAALGAAGVRIVLIRRAWDATWWPQATRGYFPFWAEVKRVEGEQGTG